MASENENPDVVVVVAPMVKNDDGKEETLESELSKKLEIGEGSKAPMVENDSGKEEPLESEFSKKLVIEEEEEEEGNGFFFKERTMSKKMVVLKSSDGEIFEIDEAIAVQSQTISHIVEDDCATKEIPLANVTGAVLSKVIEYCKKHVGDDDSEFASVEVKEDLKKWDVEFMEMDQSKMYELIMAANYLNVKGLLALACQTVADMISACKTAEKIREKFGIENDFTPEEEEQVRQENQWAFE